jgi:Beta-glucosidase/6-phospho-beta-glucosidase/beta-galactosidase
VVPSGIRGQLNGIAKRYNNPPVLITENGFSDTGELNDTGRINYYTVSKSHSTSQSFMQLLNKQARIYK